MAPRSVEANQAIIEDRRAHILEVALKVFVARGYEGTRIQDIATRAGLSYGLVYHYFTTKEAVFTALAGQALDAADKLIGGLGAIPSDPEIKAAAIGTVARYSLMGTSPAYFAIIFQILTIESVPSGLRERARACIQRYRELMAEVCESAGEGAQAAADSIFTILLGASLFKLAGLSDGAYASEAASILMQSTEQGAEAWKTTTR